ncbi:pantoate--beta-alanine ligase [uncultured Sunxiuqinia sp.]|uniref:pantoate--beta-alanine ligase n=1 Tax=uncultured Sunxiuqinia sp. TaxID=1573825 RepID=UPI002AA5EBC1|nr:pantoate--beta-alanine ligase [uncultured Sunxiuqinia sp.]
MLVVKEITELQAIIDQEKKEGKTIGFVPTMGALHNGHISLVETATQQSNYVIVSIFVNPTQFNDKKDLINYPRTLERDLKLLDKTSCNLVFSPDTNTMYPEEDKRQFNFGQLETVMEGQFRPGHFNGVAQVVSKLFEIVKPDKAFFGLKDFQQLVIIKALVKQLNLPIEIVPCPIVRENDGLAMSSRNQRLTEEQRHNASHIYKTLCEARNKAHIMSVKELKRWVTETINQNEFLEEEYFEISDDEQLNTINDWNSPLNKVGCIAVQCGEVRLIDNIVFE